MRERERELHPPLGVGTPRDPTSLSALAQNLENDGNSRRPNTSFIWNNRDVMIYKSYILCTITFKCFYTSFYEIRNMFGCFVITFYQEPRIDFVFGEAKCFSPIENVSFLQYLFGMPLKLGGACAPVCHPFCSFCFLYQDLPKKNLLKNVIELLS